MLKYVLVFCLAIMPLAASDFLSKQGETVTLEVCQEDDLDTCREIFVAAFMEAYKEFSEETLGVSDKRTFLFDAFADVYDDLRQGEQQLMVARIDGKIIGFAGFKATEIPHQIYLSQLAVDPDYWQQGIGSHLVFSALDLYEDTTSLVVIPRRINSVARNFYFRLGFIESDYMHPGYNPARYVGYEWKR